MLSFMSFLSPISKETRKIAGKVDSDLTDDRKTESIFGSHERTGGGSSNFNLHVLYFELVCKIPAFGGNSIISEKIPTRLALLPPR